MPSHRRMRGFDRDLIRGGHYGQRSCEPHLKAEHMAAQACDVKISLANPEPSTHGTFGEFREARAGHAWAGHRAPIFHGSMFQRAKAYPSPTSKAMMPSTIKPPISSVAMAKLPCSVE